MSVSKDRPSPIFLSDALFFLLPPPSKKHACFLPSTPVRTSSVPPVHLSAPFLSLPFPFLVSSHPSAFQLPPAHRLTTVLTSSFPMIHPLCVYSSAYSLIRTIDLMPRFLEERVCHCFYFSNWQTRPTNSPLLRISRPPRDHQMGRTTRRCH